MFLEHFERGRGPTLRVSLCVETRFCFVIFQSFAGGPGYVRSWSLSHCIDHPRAQPIEKVVSVVEGYSPLNKVNRRAGSSNETIPTK